MDIREWEASYMKVVASDYDGTLRTQEQVEKKDIDMIRAFRKAGNMFGLVSGRSMESMISEIKSNQIPFDFIVVNNGGVVYDADLHKLQCVYFDFDQALDIISYIKTLHCASYIINDGYHRYKFSVDPTQEDFKYGHVPQSIRREEQVLDDAKIAQLVISIHDSMRADEIAAYINMNFRGYAVAYVNVNCVDIVPFGISKAQGLYVIESEYNLCHDDIYVIGDSFNDLPMLEEFQGYAVAHAQSVIKDQAQGVYVSVGALMEDLMKRL